VARERGFTLIELMVVFAIMALVMAVAPVAYDRMRSSAQYREVVRGVLAEMKMARQQALLSGREAVFSMNLQDRTYGLDGAPERLIPAAVSVRATVAASEVSEGSFAIRFLPSGGSSGGSVDVARPSGDGVRLRVDWFSGRVEQEVLHP